MNLEEQILLEQEATAREFKESIEQEEDRENLYLERLSFRLDELRGDIERFLDEIFLSSDSKGVNYFFDHPIIKLVILGPIN
ncbi:hypothetical protein ACFL21_00745 [Patescibacteria group bacterium]